MESITLGDAPGTAKQLEDYLAALFQASQHYVEKNITEKDFTQVLELDVVATSYAGAIPSTVLAEAKSGDWGFPDAFKLYGWMNYLHINRGALCVKQSIKEKPAEKMQAKLGPLGIAFLEFPDVSTAIAAFNASGLGHVADKTQLHLWIWSNWIERCLTWTVRQQKKLQNPPESSKQVFEYFTLINDGIFFATGMLERLDALYGAFKLHPRLSSSVAYEIETGSHLNDPPSCKAYREALFNGKHELVQAAFFLEHRAKLAITKALSDHAAEVGASGAPVEETLTATLPSSVITGFLEIYKDPYFVRYPLFWQTLLWCFGGFLLTDRLDQEYAALEAYTGIPVSEVPNALRALDVLFPVDGGEGSWLANLGATHIQIVKMVPCVFRGLGANHRRQLYGKAYEDLGYTDWTAQRLSEWANATFNLLSTIGPKVVQ